MSPRRRRGAVAVFVALGLVALLGVVALVVDLGYMRMVHAQLQAGADASALAGASQLNGTPDGMDAARGHAVAVGLLNNAHGDVIALDPNPANAPGGDVVLGRWDPDAEVFVPHTDPAEVDAIEIRARRDELVALFSRAAFGTEDLGASARSVAISGGRRGAGSVPYYLPFALPSCQWDTHDEDELSDMEFVLNPAGVDNTGWAMVGGHPTASWIGDHLAAIGPCMEQYHETGQVDDSCAPASTASEVGMGTGEIAVALRDVAEAVEDGIPWDSAVWGDLPSRHPGSSIDASRYGHVLEGPIPVFASDPDYCTSGGPWNTSEPIMGFVWAAIYDVRAKGAAANRNLWLRIDWSTLRDIGTGGGGVDYGITAPGPAVVVQ